MSGLSSSHLRVLLVVVAVAVAGCGGGGGTETAAPTDSTESGPGEETTQAPDDESGPETAVDEESTTGTDESDGQFDLYQTHRSGIRDAGRYNYTYYEIVPELTDGEITGMEGRNVTIKRIFETNEQYTTYPGVSAYRPPNSETAYLNAEGRVTEEQPDTVFPVGPSGTNVSVHSYSMISASAFTTEPPEFVSRAEAVDGSTALGPADKYVIDSADQVSSEPVSPYGQVEEFEFTIWIDRETGVIAKYRSEKTVVQDGETYTVRVGYEITELSSTTIETPDWVPE